MSDVHEPGGFYRNLHLAPGGTWQVAAVAPLAKWPVPIQRDLATALGHLSDPVVLVLERVAP